MDKNNLKISVIIPVYNVEKYLARCLDSILLQAYPAFEIICVDDGSTDNSPLILKKYARKDKRIKIVNQKNQGQSVARNKGLDIATGDYIYFIDSDDYASLGLFEKFAQIVKKERRQIDIFVFNAVFKYEYQIPYGDSMGKVGIISDWGDFSKSHFKDWRHFKNPYNFDMALWIQFYRREMIEKNHIRFAPGLTFQDKLFCAEAYLATHNVYVVEDYMYTYRKHPTSVLYNLNKNVFDCYAIADGLERVYKKHHHFKSAKYQFFEHLVRQMFYHVHRVPHELENKFWDEGRARLKKLYPLLENAETLIPKGCAIYQDIISLSAVAFREKYKRMTW